MSEAFDAGVAAAMTKVAGDIKPHEDTTIISLKELMRVKDPQERKRYFADMAANNHRLAMARPSSTRGAVAAQK